MPSLPATVWTETHQFGRLRVSVASALQKRRARSADCRCFIALCPQLFLEFEERVADMLEFCQLPKRFLNLRAK